MFKTSQRQSSGRQETGNEANQANYLFSFYMLCVLLCLGFIYLYETVAAVTTEISLRAQKSISEKGLFSKGLQLATPNCCSPHS